MYERVLRRSLSRTFVDLDMFINRYLSLFLKTRLSDSRYTYNLHKIVVLVVSGSSDAYTVLIYYIRSTIRVKTSKYIYIYICIIHVDRHCSAEMRVCIDYTKNWLSEKSCKWSKYILYHTHGNPVPQ